jgi:hypothetical protein
LPSCCCDVCCCDAFLTSSRESPPSPAKFVDAPFFKSLVGRLACNEVPPFNDATRLHFVLGTPMETRARASASRRQQAATPPHPSSARRQAESPQGSGSRPVNPTRTNKGGLSENVQKQLLQDIEDSGGLRGTSFDLKHICDSKTDVYSLPPWFGSKKTSSQQSESFSTLESLKLC